MEQHISECPICYESKVLKNNYLCHHNICDKCFLSWSEYKKTCPVCNSLEVKKQINNPYIFIHTCQPFTGLMLLQFMNRTFNNE